MAARRARPAGELGRDRPEVAAGEPHGALDLAGERDLGHAGPQTAARRRQADRSEIGSLAQIVHLARRLDQPQIAQQPGGVGDAGRRERRFERDAEGVGQGVGLQFDRDAAVGHAFLARDSGDQGGRIVGVQMILPDVVEPRGLGGERPVDVAHQQGRRVVAGGEHQGLRAVDADPAVVAGEVVEMLGRDRDAAGEPGVGQAGPRPRQSLAMLGFGKRREDRSALAHRRLSVCSVGRTPI